MSRRPKFQEIVTNVVEFTKQCGEKVMPSRLFVMKHLLARLANEKCIVNGTIQRKEGEDVFVSHIIEKMIEACTLNAATGGVWIVSAPDGMGKSVAAEFLIHGDHLFRPKRSLKLSAMYLSNFPTDFAMVHLCCPKAAPELSLHLCQALNEEYPVDAKTTSDVHRLLQSASCGPRQKISYSERLRVGFYGPSSESMTPSPRFRGCPVLIIDDFDEDSQENLDFVEQLYRDASTHHVTVFILTARKAWASKMVALNQGLLIRPLVGNVENEGYDGTSRCMGPPEWNNLQWSVPQLRELVRPACRKVGLDPGEVVPYGVKWRPAQALNRVDVVFRQKLLPPQSPRPRVPSFPRGSY